jgi:hypothetical protein
VVSAVTTICPRSVNLPALLSRLSRTWRRRCSSVMRVGRVGGDDEFEGVMIGGEEREDGVADLLEQADRRDLGELEVDGAGLDAGDIEEVVDEGEELLAGVADLVEVGGVGEVALVGQGLLDQLAVAEDRIEGGPQLVADVAQELGLAAILGLGPGVRLLEGDVGGLQPGLAADARALEGEGDDGDHQAGPHGERHEGPRQRRDRLGPGGREPEPEGEDGQREHHGGAESGATAEEEGLEERQDREQDQRWRGEDPEQQVKGREDDDQDRHEDPAGEPVGAVVSLHPRQRQDGGDRNDGHHGAAIEGDGRQAHEQAGERERGDAEARGDEHPAAQLGLRFGVQRRGDHAIEAAEEPRLRGASLFVVPHRCALGGQGHASTPCARPARASAAAKDRVGETFCAARCTRARGGRGGRGVVGAPPGEVECAYITVAALAVRGRRFGARRDVLAGGLRVPRRFTRCQRRRSALVNLSVLCDPVDCLA